MMQPANAGERGAFIAFGNTAEAANKRVLGRRMRGGDGDGRYNPAHRRGPRRGGDGRLRARAAGGRALRAAADRDRGFGPGLMGVPRQGARLLRHARADASARRRLLLPRRRADHGRRAAQGAAVGLVSGLAQRRARSRCAAARPLPPGHLVARVIAPMVDCVLNLALDYALSL